MNGIAGVAENNRENYTMHSSEDIPLHYMATELCVATGIRKRLYFYSYSALYPLVVFIIQPSKAS